MLHISGANFPVFVECSGPFGFTFDLNARGVVHWPRFRRQTGDIVAPPQPYDETEPGYPNRKLGHLLINTLNTIHPVLRKPQPTEQMNWVWLL
jgi:hypothetical protein